MAKKKDGMSKGEKHLGVPPEDVEVESGPWEDRKKEKQERIEQLRSEAKPLSELLHYEAFNVKNVYSQERSTSFTPLSEAVAGEESPRYEGGTYTESYLEVVPIGESEHDGVPVQCIYFLGKTNAMPGDDISALMPVYREETVTGLPTETEDEDRTFYLSRDYNTQESAIEIIISKIVGDYTERAADYHDYVSGTRDDS